MSWKKDNILWEVSPVKNKIIDTLMLGFTFLVTPLIIFSILYIVNIGWINTYSIHFGIYLLIVIVTVFRQKLRLKQKAVFLTFILLAIAFVGFIYFGYLPVGEIFLILSIIVAGLFHSRNLSYLSIALSLIAMGVFSYLDISGQLSYSSNAGSYIAKSISWATMGLSLITIAVITVIIVNSFEKAYLKLIAIKSDQEENYRSIFEQATDGILICNIKGDISLVNKRFCELTGYSINELTKSNIRDLLSNDELNKKPLRYDLIEKGEVVIAERKAFTKNGDLIEFESRSHKLNDGRIQIFIRNITEINKIRSEWYREKELNDRILNIIPGIFFLWDLNTRVPRLIKWNKNHELFLGYDSSMIRGSDIHLFFFKEDHLKIDNALKHIHVNQEISFEVNLRNNENTKIPYFLSAKAIEMNNKLYMLGVGLDISKRKKYESELIKSQEKFKDIYNNTSDAIFIIDFNYNVLTVNQAFKDLFGLKDAEINNLNIFDYVVTSVEKDKIKERILLLSKNTSTRFEYTIRDSENRIFPVETRACTISYEGKPAILTSLNDISERKALEKEILKSATNAEEKERERIAKELHDGLGPLLSTCRIYLHNLKHLEQKEEKDSVFNLEELIDNALAGIKEISNNISPHVLRNFGIIHATKSFIEHQSEKCQVHFKYNFDPGRRFDDIKEITAYRVITELINNTIKHAHATTINLGIAQEENILTITYRDNGIGFDYIKTFKQNKGLGLSNIHSRIKSNGGLINYESSAGQGVKVSITLPLK